MFTPAADDRYIATFGVRALMSHVGFERRVCWMCGIDARQRMICLARGRSLEVAVKVCPGLKGSKT